MQLTKTQRVALFLAIAFIGSWSLALAFHMLGGRMDRPEGRAVSILYSMVPGLAALVVQGAVARRLVAGPLGLKPRLNRWVLLAWVLPLGILLLSFAAYAVLPGLELVTTTDAFVDRLRATLPPEALEDLEDHLREHPPPHPALIVFQGLLGGVVNMFVALGEELGWRGYLLVEIEGGFWRRSMISGLVWGAWLVPWVLAGFLFPDDPGLGVPMAFAWAMLLSPALVLLRARSGTVWAPALMRGTLMALTLPASQLTVGGGALMKPFVGAVGLGATAVAVSLLVLAARRRPVRTDPSPRANG
ncbi:MAG: CPBP family intramembrane glutamic endopeptidase [Myxococcota bacterium]